MTQRFDRYSKRKPRCAWSATRSKWKHVQRGLTLGMVRTDYLPFGKPNFSEAEIEAVTAVMRSGWIGMGALTQAFEAELAAYLGAPHVVCVNSCTSALFLALKVHGVGPGDEVICPSLTWLSSANAGLYLGATPVLCEVDHETLCVTPQTVAAKLSPRTKAVVVVHFGGLAADVAALRAVLPPHVAIVEDAAHALGSQYPGGSMVGASGNLVCFSFYANKNLSTGEGGAVACADAAVAERLRSLRLHALPDDAWKRFSHPRVMIKVEAAELGYKMNYTDLQAAIGRIQLQRQAEFHTTRLAVAEIYCERIAQSGLPLKTQPGVLDPGHSRHLFLIRIPAAGRLPHRDEVLLALRDRNVGATLHYDPLHGMPLYCTEGSDAADSAGFPITEEICHEILTLPISASMDVADAAYVADQLLDILGAR